MKLLAGLNSSLLPQRRPAPPSSNCAPCPSVTRGDRRTRCSAPAAAGAVARAVRWSRRSPPFGMVNTALTQGHRFVPSSVFDNRRRVFSAGPPNAESQNGSPSSSEPSDDAEEGSMMVPIDSETRGITGEAAFGPLSVLLIGFLPEEFQAFNALMKEMEADMVKVVPCTKPMLSGTLQEALEATAPAYEKPALGQRRALVLSGMYGSEVIDVVTSYKEAGLPPAVFAAAVPNNYQRVVSELIEEVYADHNAMKQRAAQRSASVQNQEES